MFTKICTLIKRLLAGFLILLCLSGCETEPMEVKSTVKMLTEEEIAQISTDHEILQSIVSSAVLEDRDESRIAGLLQTCKELPSVENAWEEESGIVVEFKSGFIIGWLYPQDEIIPPYVSLRAASTNDGRYLSPAAEAKNMPNNSHACLIHQRDNDENRGNERILLRKLEENLTNSGFSVTVKRGGEADLSAFRNLDQYGVIYLLTHGGALNGQIWLLTGEQIPDQFTDMLREKYPALQDKTCAVLYCAEYHNSQKIHVPYYAVSDLFFDENYSDEGKKFGNSLFYLGLCHGMDDDFRLPKVLNKHGVGSIVGWNGADYSSSTSGDFLMAGLLSGNSVKYTFENLIPEESLFNNIHDENTGELLYVSNLDYYPRPKGGTMYLTEKTGEMSLVFTSHTPNQTVNYRTQIIKGVCSGFKSDIQGFIRTNDKTALLEFDGNGAFSHPVVLNEGENYIRVVCRGILEDENVLSTVVEDLVLYGDFPELALFTELRWNTNRTDVDLHLVGPGGEDCYFANETTAWGGYLDVDDVDGYGPEHITIPELKREGIYTLYAHYYASNGFGPSDVWIDVATSSGGVRSFGPHTLSDTGDFWQICTIEYPAGTIHYTSLRSSGQDSGMRQFTGLPRKK
jgi:hypothetical protein